MNPQKELNTMEPPGSWTVGSSQKAGPSHGTSLLKPHVSLLMVIVDGRLWHSEDQLGMRAQQTVNCPPPLAAIKALQAQSESLSKGYDMHGMLLRAFILTAPDANTLLRWSWQNRNFGGRCVSAEQFRLEFARAVVDNMINALYNDLYPDASVEGLFGIDMGAWVVVQRMNLSYQLRR